MRKLLSLFLVLVLALGLVCARAEEAAYEYEFLIGDWLEEETQFSVLTVRKNENGGWTTEVVSPMTHGAYLFRAEIRYDCEQDALVYTDGAFYDIPITDQEEEAELGEPTVSGTKGSFSLSQDDSGGIMLAWYNEITPDEIIRYVPESK